MKTIEEKAREYALEMNEKCDGFFNCSSLMDAYAKGASDSLAGQWLSVEDELPEEDVEVFVRYKDYVGSIKHCTAYYDGEDWYSTNGGHIRPDIWMPIPEPPKKQSHV